MRFTRLLFICQLNEMLLTVIEHIYVVFYLWKYFNAYLN